MTKDDNHILKFLHQTNTMITKVNIKSDSFMIMTDSSDYSIHTFDNLDLLLDDFLVKMVDNSEPEIIMEYKSLRDIVNHAVAKSDIDFIVKFSRVYNQITFNEFTTDDFLFLVTNHIITEVGAYSNLNLNDTKKFLMVYLPEGDIKNYLKSIL